MHVLEMNHVEKSFNGQNVLRDILSVCKRRGDSSVIGPSGSGKSTLLRCATLLEQMDKGELFYLEKRQRGTEAMERLSMLKRKN